jgi:hypothetical protein
MKDMFGCDMDAGLLLESHRGDHEYLSKFFKDGQTTYKVLKVGSRFLERQIHGGGDEIIVRYAVYTPDKWENAEKFREECRGLPRREFEVWEV